MLNNPFASDQEMFVAYQALRDEMLGKRKNTIGAQDKEVLDLYGKRVGKIDANRVTATPTPEIGNAIKAFRSTPSMFAFPSGVPQPTNQPQQPAGVPPTPQPRQLTPTSPALVMKPRVYHSREEADDAFRRYEIKTEEDLVNIYREIDHRNGR
jgi:hypothetical protein